jgi:methylglyoxal synthase
MTPQPHEPDINALVRACDVHNVAVRHQRGDGAPGAVATAGGQPATNEEK